MLLRYTIAFSLILLIAFSGCAPKKEIAQEIKTDCKPVNLDVSVNDGSMEVAWNNSCKQNISGYNIYISESPDDLGSPHNTSTYPGDTNPDDGVEYYDADHLNNGEKYYVSVRIVNTDRSLSEPTETKMVVCGPRRELELSIRYKEGNDGFSLDKNEFVNADNVDNDLYFFSKDGVDQLASPDKLNGFLKQNKFRRLDFKGDFKELKESKAFLKSNPKDQKIDVKKGDWVHIRTADNKNCLVHVLGFTGSGESRKIQLFVAYSPLAGEMIF